MSEDSKEEDCLQAVLLSCCEMSLVAGRLSSTCLELKEEELKGKKKWDILVNCPIKVKEKCVDTGLRWQWGARTMPAPPLTMSIRSTPTTAGTGYNGGNDFMEEATFGFKQGGNS